MRKTSTRCSWRSISSAPNATIRAHQRRTLQRNDTGRGCLNLNGGIIQKQRGAVGLTSGQGYIKRYQYNTCAVSDPPPYFPTTGRFARNRVFELDPRNFDVAAWFNANQNN